MTQLFFSDELSARKAINDCFNLGYYGVFLGSCNPEKYNGAKCCINVHNDMVGTLKLRYNDFITVNVN